MMSMCGSSSTVHGVGVNLFGPTIPYGPTLSAKTASQRIVTPLRSTMLPFSLDNTPPVLPTAPALDGISTRNEACPIHVALILLSQPGVLRPQSGFLTCTSSFRSSGTGTKFLVLSKKRFSKTLRRPCPLLLKDGHGFVKAVGGLPTQWLGAVPGLGGDGSREGRAVTLVVFMLRNLVDKDRRAAYMRLNSALLYYLYIGIDSNGHCYHFAARYVRTYEQPDVMGPEHRRLRTLNRLNCCPEITCIPINYMYYSDTIYQNCMVLMIPPPESNLGIRCPGSVGP